MTKHIFLLLFIFVVVLPCRLDAAEGPRRGMFVSVIQTPWVLENRADISKLIDYAKKNQVNTLFVQIYRANQAWFPSQLADGAPYQICLKKVGQDPLALLMKEAHAQGIEVHAWLNLLSLSQNKSARILQKYGTEILTRNPKAKRTLEGYKIDNQYFLEPGDLRVRAELESIVEEVLRAYPELDGIQFDYIRYPDVHPNYGFTAMNISRFKKATGLENVDPETLVWKDWKRAQVTEFLAELISRTRSVRPKIQISTTGCSPYVRAYHEAFQDWPAWLKRGMVDFVTFMSYSDDLKEFQGSIGGIKNVVGDFSKVNIAVGAYKFVKSPRGFHNEFDFCEKAGGRSCVVFHYGSMLENSALTQALQKPAPAVLK